MQKFSVEQVRALIGDTKMTDLSHDDVVSWMKPVMFRAIGPAYYGDYLILLREGESFGFLVWGYGSCSYCDELYGCKNEAQLVSILNRLITEVIWLPAPEMCEFLAHRDWKGTHIRPVEDAEAWAKKAIKIIRRLK